MNWRELLALGLELWTAIGLVGLTISLVRREREKLTQSVGSLVGVWVIYLGILLVVSYRQPEDRVAMGRASCFHNLCLTVQQVEEIPGFPARNHVRLVRLTIQAVNQGASEAQEDLHARLKDAQGRTWLIAGAVSGNPLNGRVLAHGTVVSEPVFQIAADATGLELLVTHGSRWRRALVMGDPESLGHRPRVMMLDR